MEQRGVELQGAVAVLDDVLVELELGVAEGPVAEVVDGGGGAGEEGVEEADGLGPVAAAAEARELPAVGAHGGGGGDRSPEVWGTSG